MRPGDTRFESEPAAPSNGLPDSAQAPHLAEQTVFFGRYRILRELGRGGMGVVFLARDEELGIEVALKLLPDLVFQDDDALAELKREVLSGISLTHPGIVRTHGFARDEAMAGIVMEYVDGGSFALLKRQQPGGCFDTENLLPWMEQLCPILDFAHFQARIAHRDLKPSNLMFTSAGHLKVADFGISSALCESVSRVSVRAHTSGTPAYMSPQQVMGGAPSHLDDVYSLGATIYELLTGKPPFHRGQVVAQIKDCVPQSMAERRIELGVEGKQPIPPFWERTVAACLAKDPSERPRSAGDVLTMLVTGDVPKPMAEAARTDAHSATQADVPSVPKWAKPGVVSAAAAVAATLLAFVFWPAGESGSDPSTLPENRSHPGRDAATANQAQPAPGEAPPVDPRLQPDPLAEQAGPREDHVAGSASGSAGQPSAGAPVGVDMPPTNTPDTAFPLAMATARDLAAAEAGDLTFIDLGGGVEMVFCGIPAGTFLMGSPADEPERGSDETPHEVTLTKAFWLARTEVTQAQWQVVMGGNPSQFRGKEFPVDQVTWNEAAEFCRKLTEIERMAGTLPAGWRLTLPTEAQWEYACRAGTTGMDGDGEDLSGVGWHLNNSSNQTHPVATLIANAWGLHDMHGNVWEWCADWYGDYPTGGVTDPTGPGLGAQRIFRGGAATSQADHCRAALRARSAPGSAGSGFRGFRPALVLSGPPSQTGEDPSRVLDGVAGDGHRVLPPIPGSGSRAGEERRFEVADGVAFTMCWIPPGEFGMGTPESSAGRNELSKDEPPLHVIIRHGFWLSKGECANSQWRSVMAGSDSSLEAANLPVVDVSWDDCQRFLGNLRIPRPGWQWSLPTEAQWEYACRAGTIGPYGGSGDLNEMGWHDGNSGQKIHPVGTKKANAWGLHDMHGNAAEWCGDWYGEYPSGEVTDPTGPATGTHRVTRGGSWYSFPASCRSASRSKVVPATRSYQLGLRPALVPAGSQGSGSGTTLRD